MTLEEDMKFIAIGELMLRLSPPNYEKLVTTHDFRVNYGGAEANVAVSLANLGVDSTFFTVLPNSDLGKSTINYLKSNDVHTKHIIRSEGRMGLYYLEEGVSVRPSQVIYDRADSAFAEYDYKDVDFEEILKDYDWLHISGITPALSYNCRKMMDMAVKAAKKMGLTAALQLGHGTGNGHGAAVLWPQRHNHHVLCGDQQLFGLCDGYRLHHHVLPVGGQGAGRQTPERRVHRVQPGVYRHWRCPGHGDDGGAAQHHLHGGDRYAGAGADPVYLLVYHACTGKRLCPDRPGESERERCPGHSINGCRW